MKDLIKRLTNLLSIKSILSLALTGGFLYMVFNGSIAPEVYMSIYSAIIAFYFSSQLGKEK